MSSLGTLLKVHIPSSSASAVTGTVWKVKAATISAHSSVLGFIINLAKNCLRENYLERIAEQGMTELNSFGPRIVKRDLRVPLYVAESEPERGTSPTVREGSA
jgi:hypothetical protein